LFTLISCSAPRCPLRIRKPDIDRTKPEDSNRHRFTGAARHTVIVVCARGTFDEASRGNLICLVWCEVGAAVDPPSARECHLDAVSGITVRRTEPARSHFMSTRYGPGLSKSPYNFAISPLPGGNPAHGTKLMSGRWRTNVSMEFIGDALAALPAIDSSSGAKSRPRRCVIVGLRLLRIQKRFQEWAEC
jgi:hypothetical protein